MYLNNLKLYLMILGFVSILLGTAYPKSSALASDQCYAVRNAGIVEVNGQYEAFGTDNGRPIYKHNSSEYYIVFNAFGLDINEWNITTSTSGGKDLYFYQSASLKVPVGYWPQGMQGFYPGARVTSIPCPGSEEAKVDLVFSVEGGQRLDAYKGNVGIFTPVAFTSGTITLTDIPANHAPHKAKLNIVGKVLKVDIRNEEGREFTKYLGYNYIWFNLNQQTAKLWAEGNLQIYKHNLNGRKWIQITTYFIDSGEYGRVAALIFGPGYYTLGTSE